MKALVVIPTYNEKQTLPFIINSVLARKEFEVLVVDDGSPDGTAGVVKGMMSGNERLFLIERPGKLGLGTAYVTGFKWGLQRGYDCFIEMDADNSHDPEALPYFAAEIEKGAGLIIGSRYLSGTISVIGWDFRRLLLSKFGNFYASTILSLGLTDMTSGFRCYSRKALESIDLGGIHSNGYSFQIEMAYRVSAAGFKVGEIPIIFREREWGDSKMSKKIVREAVILPWRLRLGRILGGGRERMPGELNYNLRTMVGFVTGIAGLIEGLWLGWWLSTEGNIIDLLHEIKMGLPAWAWVTLKIGLSCLSAALFISVVAILVMSIFGQRKKT